AISNNKPIAQKSDGSFVCGSSDCDVWDEENQVFNIDETEKRIAVKEAHKAAIKARRKSIYFGTMRCQCSGAPLDVLCNDENRMIIKNGANDMRAFPIEIGAHFPNGLVVVTGDGDEDFMTIPSGSVVNIEESTAMTSQMAFDVYHNILINNILLDFNDSEMPLDEFESKNYVTDVYCYNDVFDASTSDGQVFAQPVEVA
ncbi:unnamed protein product, partial [marine sediment metagenome]